MAICYCYNSFTDKRSTFVFGLELTHVLTSEHEAT